MGITTLQEDRKYDCLGIQQYIMDNAKITNFDEEYSPKTWYYGPGRTRHSYNFIVSNYDVGGKDTEVVLYSDTWISPYGGKIEKHTSGVVFIHKGNLVNITYENAVNNAEIEQLFKNLKLTEEVLDEDNYERTKKLFAESMKVVIKGKTKIKVNKKCKYTIRCVGIHGKVKWSVNKKKLAKVTKNGTLKALKKGSVKLTAKIKNVKATTKIKIVK